MTLRELRKNKGITQQEAANFLGVPLRTYSNYENDIKKQTSIKYIYMLEKLYTYGYVDEENGILTLDEIKKVCVEVFSKYSVEYCYLFGSYAKGEAGPESDVDLLIEKGKPMSLLKLSGMRQQCQEALNRSVDMVTTSGMEDAFQKEIAGTEILIYEE